MTQTRSTPAGSSGPLIDKSSIVPTAAFIFAAIAAPFITFLGNTSGETNAYVGASLLNEIAWPAMAAAAMGVAAVNSSRLGKVLQPRPVFWLYMLLALALASTVWSVKPGVTLIRSLQQAFLIISIALTPLLASGGRASDMMRVLFLCFALGVTLNLLLGGRTIDADGTDIGYAGILGHKNDLGQFAGIAFLVALHEAFHRGSRRALGIIFVILAIVLLFATESKTSRALAFLSPVLAGLMLTLYKSTRISSLVILSILMFLGIYFKTSLGWYVFHDATFTGRTYIWDFVGIEIDARPLLGWGCGSFWLSGPDSPAALYGPGWVANMPHAHNGYLDIILQFGYVGFACLIMLISTTIRTIEGFFKRDPARAWLLLSMTIFILFNNHLESSWMHGGDFLWVVFVIICVETGRCWQLYQPARTANARLKPAGPGAARPIGPPVRAGFAAHRPQHAR